MEKDPNVSKFLNFYYNNEIGKFITRRGPDGRVVCAMERPIKTKEMPPEFVKLLQAVVDEYSALRVNIICSMDGEVDRIEVYRIEGD